MGWDLMGLWLPPSLFLPETQYLGSLAVGRLWEEGSRWDLPLLTSECISSQENIG